MTFSNSNYYTLNYNMNYGTRAATKNYSTTGSNAFGLMTVRSALPYARVIELDIEVLLLVRFLTRSGRGFNPLPLFLCLFRVPPRRSRKMCTHPRGANRMRWYHRLFSAPLRCDKMKTSASLLEGPSGMRRRHANLSILEAVVFGLLAAFSSPHMRDRSKRRQTVLPFRASTMPPCNSKKQAIWIGPRSNIGISRRRP